MKFSRIKKIMGLSLLFVSSFSFAASINNIQLTAPNSSQSNIAVHFNFVYMPWKMQSPWQGIPAVLTQGQGVTVTQKKGDKSQTEQFWNSLSSEQQSSIQKLNFHADDDSVSLSHVSLSILKDGHINITATSSKAGESNFQALTQALAYNEQADYPYIMSTPALMPSFFPKGMKPKQLTPLFYNHARGSISFDLNTQDGANALMLIILKHRIAAYQVVCAMHCAPVMKLTPKVSVYVTTNGQGQWLMKDGKMTPIHYDSAKPVEISVYTHNQQSDDLPWQHLLINYQSGSLTYWRSNSK